MATMLALPKAVKQMIKRSGGAIALQATQDQVAAHNYKTQLKEIGAQLVESTKAGAKKVKAMVQANTTQVVFGGVGTGLGILAAVYGYDYLVEYFGADSYVPDIAGPAAGLVVGGIGYFAFKDPPSQPGENAVPRSLAIGGGMGLALGGIGKSALRYSA